MKNLVVLFQAEHFKMICPVMTGSYYMILLYDIGKYSGNDETGKLTHDFSCNNLDDMNYETLAKSQS